MEEKLLNKEVIIAEFLNGKYSYRQLGIKHGIDFRKIYQWMSNYKGKTKPLKKQVKALNQDITLPNEVEQLQAELRQANRTMKCWK